MTVLEPHVGICPVAIRKWGENLFMRNPGSGGLDHVVTEEESISFGTEDEVWGPNPDGW